MSLKDAAQHLAAHGRNGDTTLVHMTPDEVRGLQQLAKQHGTSLTINPHTGLPEAFSLSGLAKAALPIAAGAMLGPAGYGLMTAAEAGLAVGGGMALLTGSLEKGLMAGLGAYGGAGATGAASTAGTAEISKEAGAKALAQGLTEAEQEAAVHNALRESTGLDKILAGAAHPGTTATMAGGAGQLAKYGMAAAAPAMMDQPKLDAPTGVVSEGYIRPKYYDYRTQTYYDLPAVKAKDWGAQSIDEYRNRMVAKPVLAADGGMMSTANPYSDETLAYNNSPVVRMADGGSVQNYADGGFTDAQVASYIVDNNLSGKGLQDAADVFQVSADQLARAQALISANDPGISTAHNAYLSSVEGRPDLVAQNLAFYDPSKQTGTGWEDVAIDRWVDTNPNATFQQIREQAQKDKISDEAINRAFDRFGYSAADKMVATSPTWKNELGISGFAGLSSNINRFAEKLQNTGNRTPAEQRAIAYDAMYQNGMNMNDVVRATGKTIEELFPDKKPVIVKPGGTGGTGVTPGGNYGTPTIDPRTTTPGDIRTNEDNTRTVTPNIPGRPEGGFTGMQQVRDTYTAGGGNLGQVLKPTKSYTNTGRSADAYGYLFGERNWPSYQQTQPVYGNTIGNTAQKYIWKDGLLVLNPDYVDPALAQAKTVTAPVTEDPTSPGGANGGLMAAYAAGGQTQYNLGGYSDGGRLLRGPGDGVSDSIPATIGNKQPARLADGEFVVPARIVSELGNGSTEAGARKLYAMMDRVQKARGKTVGKGKVAKNTRADKYLPG